MGLVEVRLASLGRTGEQLKMIRSDAELARMAARLYARRNDTIDYTPVRIKGIVRADGSVWQPERNDCHMNVDLLCAASKGEFSPVRGWRTVYRGDYINFYTHSI